MLLLDLARVTIGPEKSSAGSAATRSPSCSRRWRVRTSSTAPSRQLAELERAERHADQAVHRQAEMAEHVLDLAVLALAHGEDEPHIGALLALELCVDRPVVDAVDA